MHDFVSVMALALIPALFSISCFLILMLILRPFWCWYFKVTRKINSCKRKLKTFEKEKALLIEKLAQLE